MNAVASYLQYIAAERRLSSHTVAAYQRDLANLSSLTAGKPLETLDASDIRVAIVKLFFHVTQETQDKRLKSRLDHPWKRWKVNAEDFRNRDRRPAYLDAMADMFAHTDTRWAPWTVIDGNNKKSARIAALTHVADALTEAFPAEPPPMSEALESLARRLG